MHLLLLAIGSAIFGHLAPAKNELDLVYMLIGIIAIYIGGGLRVEKLIKGKNDEA